MSHFNSRNRVIRCVKTSQAVFYQAPSESWLTQSTSISPEGLTIDEPAKANINVMGSALRDITASYKSQVPDHSQLSTHLSRRDAWRDRLKPRKQLNSPHHIGQGYDYRAHDRFGCGNMQLA